ncbi:MAG: chemotaxis protein CheW [Spirochaetes bacterium GWD1_27_9]|nr:MAG: chemotaxis protein CheW [Spirochaetes bacterium GWB1_27_13]OHD37831.1 MAG: chemotaxis protein CheW [Spirochaetes bacterium GWD1_27_9]
MTENKAQFEADIMMVDDDDDDTMANRYLSFRIENEDYGIPIQNVIEIIELQKIIEIPDMPDFVKGVINLRGRVIPIMDLRLRFHFVEKEHDDRTCIVIVNINDSRIGLIVDRVEEVLEISANNVEPPPKFKNKSNAEQYISGLGKTGDSIKIILDVGKIISEDNMEEIKNIEL